jgi:hypothetical protein
VPSLSELPDVCPHGIKKEQFLCAICIAPREKKQQSPRNTTPSSSFGTTNTLKIPGEFKFPSFILGFPNEKSTDTKTTFSFGTSNTTAPTVSNPQLGAFGVSPSTLFCSSIPTTGSPFGTQGPNPQSNKKPTFVFEEVVVETGTMFDIKDEKFYEQFKADDNATFVFKKVTVKSGPMFTFGK